MAAAVKREKHLQGADSLKWQPLPGHPWTVDPWCTRYDEVIVRRDVTDTLLHTCMHNKPTLLGRVKLPVAATVISIPISLPWAAFDRPCIITVETPDCRKFAPAGHTECWSLRHTVQICHTLTLRREGKLEVPSMRVDFREMAWSQRNAGQLVCVLQDGARTTATASAFEIPTDDGRCLLRMITIPALARLATLTSGGSDLLPSLVTAVQEYFYGCRLGSRRPDWLPVKTWSTWRGRIVDKGAMPTVDSLPSGLRGTMYESLALAAAAAMFADAAALPIAHRLLPNYSDVEAAMVRLQTHVTGSDNARHRYAMADGRVWLPVAAAVRTIIYQRLVEAISQCSGGDVWTAVTAPLLPAPGIRGLKKRRHLEPAPPTTPLPAHFLYDTWPAREPWMCGTHSAECTWRWHQEAAAALATLPFAVEAPVVTYYNCMTAEIRDAAPDGTATLPDGWAFVGKGVPGAPIWVKQTETGAVSPFPWDCRCVLVERAAYRLAHALDHPSSAVPFPWMLLEAGALPPEKPGFIEFCRMNANWIAQRTCGITMYHTLDVVDGTWQETSLLSGEMKHVDNPAAFFPLEVAFPTLPYSNFRPYSLLLETMHPELLRFQLLKNSVPVKSMPAVVYRQLLAAALHNGRCNVACDAVGTHAWSAQPAVVHVTFAGDVVTFFAEDILPVLRPFVAVSTPCGEVVQIIDERAVSACASAILYRRPGYCQVPYCHLPGKMYGILLCPYHADEASSCFGIGT